MKFLSCLLLVLCLTSLASAEETALPRDRQEQIVQDYLYVTGHASHMSPMTSLSLAAAGETHAPIKCGMSAIADFVLNRNRLDPDFRAALGADSLWERPVLPLEYVSPSGYFKIHYTKTGTDSVYQASKDSDADGVPDYVESTSIIADSVYGHIVNDLGYPAPASDSFYPSGGDHCYDIYIVNLPGAYYGASYIDSVNIDGPGGHRATSFMELDNDYRLLDAYRDRPLDAIRVTMAHEFFHAVQFGIDYTEAEDFGAALPRRYWMEMSSVWMEEELYTRINDYYGYLNAFFDDPTRSLQQFANAFDLHPYGAGVFPIFLAQNFNKDVIRETWLRCGEYGRGPHFLVALDHVLDSMSNHQEDISSAFARFALWNYYTGDRAALRPDSVGYEEADHYPAIPDSAMAIHRNLDLFVPTSQALAPQHMAATYLYFPGSLAIQDQIWVTANSVDPDTLCVLKFVDSLSSVGATAQVPLGFVEERCPDYRQNPVTCPLRGGCSDTVQAILDSSLDLYCQVDKLLRPWWVTTVDRLLQRPDSNEIEADPVVAPQWPTTFRLPDYHPERLFSKTVIISAASTDLTRYVPRERLLMAYLMSETRDTAGTTNSRASVLYAYPNPARLGEMNPPTIKFRFRVPTDQLGMLTCNSSVYMVVDIFNLAGERIATVEGSNDVSPQPRESELVQDLSWNVRNSGGEQVASGAYLGVARLYCDRSRQNLLSEKTVKVAVIR